MTDDSINVTTEGLNCALVRVVTSLRWDFLQCS